MDEAPNGGGELSGSGGGDADPAWDPAAGAADREVPGEDPVARALADEAAEIRRMVEAGAGSPEAIRALAERLREHRAREEALWRAEVKPALVKQGRGRLRGTGPDASARSPEHARSWQALWLGMGLLALVAVVVVAASTSVWLLLLPVAALLVWAWTQGRDRPAG
jgi:hypothetical protein